MTINLKIRGPVTPIRSRSLKQTFEICQRPCEGDRQGRRPACHAWIVNRRNLCGQRGPAKVPEPFRNIILVLDEFLDGPVAEVTLQDSQGVVVFVRRNGCGCGVYWSITPLATGQAVP